MMQQKELLELQPKWTTKTVPEGLWLEKRWGRGEEGKGWLNRLGKEPIESGMILDGSDTISGHVPAQGTQLRS